MIPCFTLKSLNRLIDGWNAVGSNFTSIYTVWGSEGGERRRSASIVSCEADGVNHVNLVCHHFS